MLVCSKGNFSSPERLKDAATNHQKSKIQEYFTTRCPECHAEYNTAASMLEHLASHCATQPNLPCWVNGFPPGTTPGVFVSPPEAMPDRNGSVFVPIAVPVSNLSELVYPPLQERESITDKISKSEDGSEISSDSDRMDIDESRCSSPEDLRIDMSDVSQEPIDLSKDSCITTKTTEEAEMYELDPLNLCMVTMENEKLEMASKVEGTMTNGAVEEDEEEEAAVVVKPERLEIIEAVGLRPVEDVDNAKPKTLLDAPPPIPHNVPKKTPAGRRKHECFYCRKEFSGSTALKRHILLHTGEKPFKCNFCNCAYTRKFMLEKHMKVWHDDTTEELMDKGLCPYCKKEFKSLDQLKTHMTHHVNEGSHRCKLCNMAFRYHAMLREHMTKVHLCPDMTSAKVSDTEGKHTVQGPCSSGPQTQKKVATEKPSGQNGVQVDVALGQGETMQVLSEGACKTSSIPSVKVVERKFCCDLCGAAFHKKQHLQKHEETTVHIVRDKAAGTEAKVLVTPKREEGLIVPKSAASSPPPVPIQPLPSRSHNPNLSVLKVPVFTDVKLNKKEFECETCGAEFQYRAQYVFHLLNHEK